MNEQNNIEEQNILEGQPKREVKVKRKVPKKSPYLFPAYNFGEARRIAKTVEQDGGGVLTEETLAVNLRQSAKSSGFRLRTLTARQFQLLTKQGNNLSTTPLAKAIYKPTSEEERKEAIIRSFMAIPLFRAVADRFRGQPLPQGEAFRNVLEREFQVDNQRVSAAERVLLDSARDAGILITSGNKIYLATDARVARQSGQSQQPANIGFQAPGYSPPIDRDGIGIQAPGMLNISIRDLAEFKEEEFQQVWSALGKIVEAKGRRMKEQEIVASIGEEEPEDEEEYKE